MPATTPSDNEITANQLAVGTAQTTSTAKRLAAQFGFGSDSSDDNDDQDAQEQEKDLKLRDFGVLGIGYTPPTTTDPDVLSPNTDSAATARLRRQLLGKNASTPKFAASKPGPATVARKRGNDASSDDDEEDGRSAAMDKTAKRQRTIGVAGLGAAAVGPSENAVTAIADGESMGEDNGSLSAGGSSRPAVPTAAPVAAAPMKKRSGTGSYLDQLLAERAAKKSKKRKKNKQQQQGTGIQSGQTS